MKYEAQWSSSNPGLIVILVDQSYSMTESYIPNPKPMNKAEFASMAVNRVINEIIESNTNGELIKKRCFIAVIGYGNGVNMIAGEMLDNIANSPKRIEKLKKAVPDGAGGIIENDYNLPIWVEPVADNGTPMNTAFSEAGKIIKAWINERSKCPAPVVINISDGLPNDVEETRKEAQAVLNLASDDGNVLIFNAHISDVSLGKVILPNDKNVLKDENAKFLFDISSEIPESMFIAANNCGLNPIKGSKGMVFNADAEALVKLLNFGSSGSIGKDRMN